MLLRTLGGLELKKSKNITEKENKPFLLLSYLAIEGHYKENEEELKNLFFPGADKDKDALLKQTTERANKRVGDKAITKVGNFYEVDLDIIDVDILKFHHFLEEDNWRKANDQSYKEPFLKGGKL